MPGSAFLSVAVVTILGMRFEVSPIVTAFNLWALPFPAAGATRRPTRRWSPDLPMAYSRSSLVATLPVDPPHGTGRTCRRVRARLDAGGYESRLLSPLRFES